MNLLRGAWRQKQVEDTSTAAARNVKTEAGRGHEHGCCEEREDRSRSRTRARLLRGAWRQKQVNLLRGAWRQKQVEDTSTAAARNVKTEAGRGHEHGCCEEREDRSRSRTRARLLRGAWRQKQVNLLRGAWRQKQVEDTSTAMIEFWRAARCYTPDVSLSSHAHKSP